MPDDAGKSSDTVSIEFHWEQADIPTFHVNQLLISHAGPEFYLVFGEVIPIDTEHPNELPSTLVVKQRVRVAIPREVMGLFVATIVQNHETFVNRIKQAMVDRGELEK